MAVWTLEEAMQYNSPWLAGKTKQQTINQPGAAILPQQPKLPSTEQRVGNTILDLGVVPGANQNVGGNWWDKYSASGGGGGNIGTMGGGGGSTGGGGGGGSSSLGSFFTPNTSPGPNEIDYTRLSQLLGIRGGGGATDIAAQAIKAQQEDLDRMKRYEEEKFNLINQQKGLTYMSPEAREQYLRQAREGIRGGQAARGVFTSGAAEAEEAYLMPQVTQQLQSWQLGALSGISSQIDPLIRATAGRAAMYQGGLP